MMYKIHCFEPTNLEGFPSNTYVTDSSDKLLNCIKKLLDNTNSGISRILIEDAKFGKSECYENINCKAPIEI